MPKKARVILSGAPLRAAKGAQSKDPVKCSITVRDPSTALRPFFRLRSAEDDNGLFFDAAVRAAGLSPRFWIHLEVTFKKVRFIERDVEKSHGEKRQGELLRDANPPLPEAASACNIGSLFP